MDVCAYVWAHYGLSEYLVLHIVGTLVGLLVGLIGSKKHLMWTNSSSGA